MYETVYLTFAGWISKCWKAQFKIRDPPRSFTRRVQAAHTRRFCLRLLTSAAAKFHLFHSTVQRLTPFTLEELLVGMLPSNQSGFSRRPIFDIRIDALPATNSPLDSRAGLVAGVTPDIGNSSYFAPNRRSAGYGRVYQ